MSISSAITMTSAPLCPPIVVRRCCNSIVPIWSVVHRLACSDLRTVGRMSSKNESRRDLSNSAPSALLRLPVRTEDRISWRALMYPCLRLSISLTRFFCTTSSSSVSERLVLSASSFVPDISYRPDIIKDNTTNYD